MYWTEAWVAILTAGLAFALWRILRLGKRVQINTVDIEVLGVRKRDRRLSMPRPRARRVDTVFHDRDDQGREHWLCVNCGASVPQMGHTVAACEEYQAEKAKAEQEQIEKSEDELAEAMREPEASGFPDMRKV